MSYFLSQQLETYSKEETLNIEEFGAKLERNNIQGKKILSELY
jgi:hypothetical protein